MSENDTWQVCHLRAARICGLVFHLVNRAWRWSELASVRVRCRKLDMLGGGNVDAPENANSVTTNTIIAANHILLADGLTLFVST